MERFANPEEALKSVHDFLRDSYWPAHLKVGDEFRVIADDLDDRDQEVPLTIRITNLGTIEFEIVSQIPNQNRTGDDDRWIDQTYRATIRQAEHPIPFRALLAVALAFRIDEHFTQPQKVRDELQKTRSPKLKAVYRLLNHLPWLKTLNGNYGKYVIPGDSSPWPEDQHNCQLGVLITPYNDTWLTIGYPSGRIRHGFGGSHLPNVFDAMYILAEAIRLESEGGTN